MLWRGKTISEKNSGMGIITISRNSIEVHITGSGLFKKRSRNSIKSHSKGRQKESTFDDLS